MLLEKVKKINFKKYIVYISFLIVFVGFSILQPKSFMTADNIINILRQTAMISVAAIGMTFAISAGQIDLSTGGIIATTSLTVALMLQHYSLPIAIVAGLAVGVACGAINGLLLTKLRIPAFLVTLGTSSIFAGIARAMTNLEAVSVTNDNFTHFFGSGDIGIVPTLFIWTTILTVIGQYVYKKTSFGRSVLAVGGNQAAARYSGIDVDKVKFWAMVICGLAAACAGILYAGRMHGARYTYGESDNMNVIAAVVIGGTSFSGGKGTVFGTLIGSLVIGMLNNGLLMMGLSVNAQMIARGIVIILAVSLSLRESKAD